MEQNIIAFHDAEFLATNVKSQNVQRTKWKSLHCSDLRHGGLDEGRASREPMGGEDKPTIHELFDVGLFVEALLRRFGRA